MKPLYNVLEALIRPLHQDVFFADYFEKNHFHTSLQDSLINFDLEKFENLLWSHENELSDRLHLNRKGEEIHYIRDREGMDSFGWVMKHFREGCTVIFNGLETLDPEAAKIALALNDVFHGPTSVNAFLTPPGAQGFLPHFDTHDVFVYQVEGQKVWDLYEGKLRLPMDDQIYLVDQAKLGKPIASYKLQIGDVLYIPRGMIHGAKTTAEHSLHLTIGIRPLLKVDYLKSLLDVLSREDADFRKSMDPEDPVDLTELIGKLKAAAEKPYFKKKTRDEKAAALVSRSRPVPGRQLRNLIMLDKLNMSSLLSKAYPGKAVIANHEDKVRLYFPGLGLSGEGDMLLAHITFDAIAYGALNFINKQEGSFLVSDMPDFYDEKTRLMIAGELVSRGFLNIEKIN